MLKGVSHIHSTYSFDGKVKLSDVKTFFEEKGFDFVLMSEHIETLGVEEIRSFISECRSLSSERFLLVPGIEIHNLNLLILGIKDIDSGTDTRDMQALIKQFQAQNAIFTLCHPVTLHTGTLPQIVNLLKGIEVWNNKYDGKLAPRIKSLNLLDHLRAAKDQLVPMCGLDFHRRSDYTKVWMEVDIEERSEESVFRAFRSGDFHISLNGRTIPIYDHNHPVEKALFYLKSTAYTVIYDSVFYAHRCFHKLGVKPPGAMKSLLKKVF